MKHIWLVIPLLYYTLTGHSQSPDKKFSWSLEYSPSFSNITTPTSFSATSSPIFQKNGFRIGHNIFLKADFKLFENLFLTTGVGLLNTTEHASIFLNGTSALGLPDVNKIESYRYHNFLVVPIGLKYKIGTFFINPEIAIGFKLSRPSFQITHLADGSVVKNRYNISQDLWGYKNLTVPLMLTVGKEIPMGPVKLLLGAKGYYSLTKLKYDMPRSQPSSHYFGFGIMAGVKF